jgi:hypothetical protein
MYHGCLILPIIHKSMGSQVIKVAVFWPQAYYHSNRFTADTPPHMLKSPDSHRHGFMADTPPHMLKSPDSHKHGFTADTPPHKLKSPDSHRHGFTADTPPHMLKSPDSQTWFHGSDLYICPGFSLSRIWVVIILLKICWKWR